MTSRKLAPLTIGAAAVVLVPLGVVATSASWNDREFVHGVVGTSTIDCADPTVEFASAASGRFLAGELLGVDIDPIANLEQMRLTLDGAGVLGVEPGNAIDLGSPPPVFTYANPFDVSALSIVGVDLTGFTVLLPGAALGAVNQYAQVATTGETVGASGLVSDSGAVLVSESTPSADLPAPATVSIGDLLPAVTGIADATLEIGAVAASSQLDGCAALASEIWGDGSVTGVTRDYGIAGLGLELDSPAVGGLVGTVNTGVTTVGAAVNSLLGGSGPIATSIGSSIDLALPNVLTTSIGGTVTLSGLDLAGAVSSLLTTPLTDGVVTIDLQEGTIDVDLDALLPSLNNAPPNTEVVLNATVLNPILVRAGQLLDAWTTQITNALRQELRTATLTIDLGAVIRAPGVAIIAPSGLDIINVSVDYVGEVGAVLDGTATFTIGAQAIGAVSLINSVLSALGLPTLTSLINTILGLSSTLVTSVANQFTNVALAAITTLGGTLSSTTGAIVTSLGGIVGALPNVLSLMVNVQPDQPGAPPGSTFTPGTATSTPQYVVSALRLGLADALVPGDVAHTVFATASAGPVVAP